MKRKQYTEEQIGFVLRQAETGTPIGEVCRKESSISTRTTGRKPGVERSGPVG